VNSAQLESQLAHFPNFFANHVLLVIGALLFGIALSLPLAALAIRKPRLAGPLLGLASIVQTIPGLALLALMVPLLGRIGVVPALLALILYSMLPILRNTVTGALEVDPNVVEAARGIGMTEDQILLRVRFPLAAPIIVAGIRTSAVWTVGMATLSTPVGATSLGNYIFSGLQTQNTVAVLLGCFGAALLAISLDALIRLAEIAAALRDGRRAWIALACFVVALGLSTAPVLADLFEDRSRPRVRVGAKTFTEQYILAALITEKLDDAGFDVVRHDGLGSTVIFQALANDEIDVYVDYSDRKSVV
jgi:osmoprotectant transport system permease protein